LSLNSAGGFHRRYFFCLNFVQTVPLITRIYVVFNSTIKCSVLIIKEIRAGFRSLIVQIVFLHSCGRLRVHFFWVAKRNGTKEKATLLLRPFGLFPQTTPVLSETEGIWKTPASGYGVSPSLRCSRASQPSLGEANICLRERSDRVYVRANEGEKRREVAQRPNRRGPFLFVSFLWASKEKGHTADYRGKRKELE
jgi:hypothetical protein